MKSLTGVAVRGTGGYVPDRIVCNDELATLGFDAEWIIQRTGIRERRYADAETATSDLAVEACRMCLAKAGAPVDEVDLLIVATMTPDSPVPSAACRVQEKLGLRCAAFDINAACAGFIYALMTGMQFVKSRTCKSVLVVGADTNSRIVNPRDNKTYPLFGDGGGAVLLGPGTEEQGALAFTLGADGTGADLLSVPGGGSRCPASESSLNQGLHYIHMDGRPVFKWAVRLLADSIADVLKHAQLVLDDVDLFAFHQANLRIIEAAADDLGISRQKIVINLDRFGNTSAASIPLCLSDADAQQRLCSGSKVLVSGFGAGLAWGTALLNW